MFVFSTCNLNDYELDDDGASVHSISRDVPTVYHRQPNYALVESDQRAHLEIELPGVSKETITLGIAGNKLAITAEQFRETQTVDNKLADCDKIPFVVYELKIRIGRRYDTEKIEASMDGNGILKMIIPMKNRS